MTTARRPFRLETTKELLVAYTSTEHGGPEVYRTLFDAWLGQFQREFGVAGRATERVN